MSSDFDPPAPPLPFVGREGEMQWLSQRLSLAPSSRYEVDFSIIGEAGVGKRRLFPSLPAAPYNALRLFGSTAAHWRQQRWNLCGYCIAYKSERRHLYVAPRCRGGRAHSPAAASFRGDVFGAPAELLRFPESVLAGLRVFVPGFSLNDKLDVTFENHIGTAPLRCRGADMP